MATKTWGGFRLIGRVRQASAVAQRRLFREPWVLTHGWRIGFQPVAQRRFDASRKEPSLRDGGFVFFVTVG
jgi:hypothetical protein